MVKITMDFDPNLTNVRDDFNLMPHAIMEVTADAIEQTALDIKGDVVREMNQPYPQGLGSDRALKLSIEIDGNRELANGLATYYVGTKLPYAQYVEYGSGPHGNSGDGSFMESIREWTSRVLGGDERDAQKIRNYIRNNGLKPRPYFRRAVVKEAPNFKLTWSTMLAERLEAEFENIT